ncbi:hypothetical protein LMG26858_02886 [Achromobacter anxifer]|uniref:Uncharacterized protein n=1 Tax=Achromobacter anxifer TaxID=1287737 RepID=A0A6S7DQ86_9BURK|nr:hypothetical protein LMG26858_02886 [Achromobacter anxifer]
MGHGHRAHDGQSQPRAGLRFAGPAAGEALLHRVLFVVGHARAAVGHGERHAEPRHWRGLDVHGAVRRIAQRVVHQIAQHLAQGHAVAGDAGAADLGRDLDAQALRLQRADAAARFVDGFGYAHEGARALAQAVGDGGVHQQLVDQLAGVRGVEVDAFQARVQPLRIGLVQGDLGLRAQGGQRRAHLVRGVGHQGIERAHDAGQALHEGVQRLD